MTTDTAHGQATVPIRRIALASFIGTCIEYFDFFIFSTASALVINKLFFPALDPLAGTLAAFAAFGVAFFMRPFGGMLFGHFGDRIGRKRMLVLSLLIMGVGTASVGLLPTYAQIGVWAPILLVVTRMLQGLAVGGEWSGAVLLAAEHAPPSRRAFFSSWPQVGIPAGLVMSSAVFYFVGLMPHDAMMSWGWRLPFIASAILVVIGLYVRLRIDESPAFKAVRERGEVAKFPALELVRTAKKSVVIALLAHAGNSVVFYMASVFGLKYAADRGTGSGGMLLALIVAAALQVVTIPLSAVLADRYGRRPVMAVGAVLTVILAFPVFWLLGAGHFLPSLVALVLAISVLHALLYGPEASFLLELFETRLRYTGSAVGYQIGSMLFSGPTPFIAAALFAWAQSIWPLAAYMILSGLLTVIGVAMAKETRAMEFVSGRSRGALDKVE
ncbi:MFS transporter [Amycolatopsis granulosa]|uniref:MFS transporter n=1 Tax=Amycolatopsis granulosa TaxID=185684 RepID=UPI0014234438|nr:MFS transporter [Amycolatopsis granulosa]NIH83362.1 metabolite-proton symporter [Amycolatopsis granulosa]